MARKKAVEPGAIEADRVYKVRFRLPHTVGRLKFSPLHSYKIKGRILAEIPAQKLASVEAA